MARKRKTCECCGSKKISEYEDIFVINDFLGNSESMIIKLIHCDDCDIDYRALDYTDDIRDLMQKLRIRTFNGIFEKIIDNKSTIASVERALSLKQGTIRSLIANPEDITDVHIALFSIVYNFDWIIDVADYKFNNIAVEEINKLIEDGILSKWKQDSGNQA